MKLYAIVDGPPSLSVRQTLKTLKVPFDLVTLSYSNGDFMSDQFYKLNPQREIPVLDDDGFLLSESNAIMQYICDKYSPDSPLYPKDPQARALVNHRLCFNLSFLYPIVLSHALGPLYFDFKRTPIGLKRLKNALGSLEEYFKRTKIKYVAGNSLTIADFPLINSIMSLESIDFDMTDYPLIMQWYQDFKKNHPDLWAISEEGLKVFKGYVTNPPDLSNMNHPFYPSKKRD